MLDRQNSLKVGSDLTWIQLIWGAWVVAIGLLVYILLLIFGANIGEEVDGFYPFIYRPIKVFMLVLGIISVSGFLTFFVKHGMTRKAYFYGTAISAVAVSFVLIAAALVIGAVEGLFRGSSDLTAFIGYDVSWLLSIVVLGLNVLVYYGSGWMIGAGFGKYGGGRGIIFIIPAVLFILVTDMLWTNELKEPLSRVRLFGWNVTDTLTQLNPVSDSNAIPLYASFLGTIAIIGFTMWTARVLTRRIRVKVK